MEGNKINEKFLSRGKCKDSREWVKGYLLYDEISGIASIVTYVNLSGVIRDLSEINIYEVIPETVERCTGLPDINFETIFDGDILEVYGEDFLAKVSWCESTARFVLNFYTTNVISDFNSHYSRQCQVIGNIYDDPIAIGGDHI